MVHRGYSGFPGMSVTKDFFASIEKKKTEEDEDMT